MDPVRRQLKLLDARLAKRKSGIGRLFAYCPLLLPAVAFSTAIVAENTCPLPVGVLFGVLLLAFGAVAYSLRLQSRTRLYLAAGAACLVFFCLGAVRLKCHYQPRGDDIRRLIRDGRALATVRGTVHTNPSCEDPDLWKFGRYHWAQSGCRFYLKANHVRSEGRWVDVSGIVLVQAHEDAAVLRRGDVIQIQCWLDGFGEAMNPGQFDIRQSLHRRNIYVAAAVESADGLQLLSKAPPGSLTTALEHLRENASGTLLDEVLAEQDAAPVLTALLLGRRSGIDIQTADAFQKTGLAHFISLSGMHLGILALTGWRLLRAAGLSRRWRAVVCILMITLYVLIIPARAPTLRAAVICWAFFLSILFTRKPNPVNTLAIAVFVGLMIRPADIFTAGWQLSYATVLGIILFHHSISNWILEQTADRMYAPLKDTRAFWLSGLLTHGVDLFAVGLAAWIGGSGILLYHFGTIGPLASVWTVAVFPLVWAILVLGFAKMALTLVFPTVALAIGLLLSQIADAFIFAVKFLAGLGLSELRIGEVSGVFIVSCYTLVLLVRFSRIEKLFFRRMLLVSTAAAIVAPLVVTKHLRTHRNDLEMTSLAVGHGQAIFVAFPGGQNAMFDAGSLSHKNCGWRVVVPFLRHKGIDRIDHLVVSHDDIDHINGIPEIVASVRVDHIRANAAVLNKAASVSTAGYLNSCLKRLGREIELLEDGVELSKAVETTVLWPTADVCQDPAVSDNDKSMVLLIEFAGRRILLCSDIETYAQEQLLAQNPDLKVDVLFMPHHGSVSNLVENFVERLAADIVVVNCRESRYASAYRPPQGVRALYTPVDGAVTIKIQADGALSATGLLNNKSESSVSD
ncbi:MAG: ComEC/Rec2 family competence protein [Phycisphaerae bacterium]|nr:ComEC/Rec2 family competence protein [Phycisphaerae bacterium]